VVKGFARPFTGSGLLKKIKKQFTTWATAMAQVFGRCGRAGDRKKSACPFFEATNGKHRLVAGSLALVFKARGRFC
jgi:hypothetical protein